MDVTLELIRLTAVVTFAATWAASALWVYLDARTRLEGGAAPRALAATALGLPGVAPLLYVCLRPSETVAERRERKLALRCLEDTLDAGERCLVCREPLEPAFLRCPSCATELKRPCPACREPLKLHWNACPHCLAHVAEPTPAFRLTA